MSFDPTYGIFQVLHHEADGPATVKRLTIGTLAECEAFGEKLGEKDPDGAFLLIDLDDIDDLVGEGDAVKVSVS